MEAIKILILHVEHVLHYLLKNINMETVAYSRENIDFKDKN